MTCSAVTVTEPTTAVTLKNESGDNALKAIPAQSNPEPVIDDRWKPATGLVRAPMRHVLSEEEVQKLEQDVALPRLEAITAFFNRIMAIKPPLLCELRATLHSEYLDLVNHTRKELQKYLCPPRTSSYMDSFHQELALTILEKPFEPYQGKDLLQFLTELCKMDRTIYPLENILRKLRVGLCNISFEQHTPLRMVVQLLEKHFRQDPQCTVDGCEGTFYTHYGTWMNNPVWNDEYGLPQNVFVGCTKCPFHLTLEKNFTEILKLLDASTQRDILELCHLAVLCPPVDKGLLQRPDTKRKRTDYAENETYMTLQKKEKEEKKFNQRESKYIKAKGRRDNQTTTQQKNKVTKKQKTKKSIMQKLE